ncbi:MAG: alpha/beta fold hydrolase [Patescibacteria group bacterium]|nr:alpha/beta fold hydrolase [Patescibacteria group bacterium]
MAKLKAKIVRLQTKDNLELQGLLFETEQPTKSAVIHIHGWTGNFYENIFLEHIAQGLIDKSFSFLTFNNRGAGFVQEFMKKNGSNIEYAKLGGSLERFEDCLIDIESAVNFMQSLGYNNLYLQGHSTGSQKAAYYASQTKTDIKGLILLEPTDDPAVTKKDLGSRYKEALGIAREYIDSGNPQKAMPDWIPFGVELSAQRFLSLADPKSAEGQLFHFSDDLNELKRINCPILAVYGAKTQYQENPASALEILSQQLPAVTTKLIDNADHWFRRYEDELKSIIIEWLRT